jgi:ABC-type sugar transport system ATPase subunit
MVMHQGAVAGFLERHEASQERIMRLAIGMEEGKK